uniref:Transposase n=1 Tax=Heterorhabditis bacteriophora TaxID=37862 RepID=A0A1I7XIC5_HETBA
MGGGCSSPRKRDQKIKIDQHSSFNDVLELAVTIEMLGPKIS